ncbi:MAG: hypothetical protein ACI910_001410 [Oleispira sp.]|jgi:uncharacterized protein (DUF58 family)
MVMPKIFQKRWQAWLERRIPPANEITLTLRSIFIVPAKVGWAFLVLLALLLVTAINYQNSLIYGLTFWLFSVAMSAQLFTYRNLSGLTIKTSHSINGFSGSFVEIPIRLSDTKRDHQGLVVHWSTKEQDNRIMITDVIRDQEKEILVPFKLLQRGYLQTPRLRIETRFPFGLYKSWTWLRLKTPGIIYPKPIVTPFIASIGEGDDMATAAHLNIGNDDFIGLRNYRPGDSLKHVAWKYLAKGKGLLSKEYDHQQISMQWLDWFSLPGMGVEERLSHLTGWILQAEQQGRVYGIKLPHLEIKPSIGDCHRDHCLKHLGLYGLDQEGESL